jgi:hypothetical protein
MDSNNCTQSNLKRLMSLQHSRLSSQEKMLNQAQKDYKQACQVLKERKDNIKIINKRIESVYGYLSIRSVNTNIEKVDRCSTYLFWLNYDLEMHEYYLSQEEEKVEEANKRYLSVRKDWYKQKQKIEKFNELYIHSNNRQYAIKEELEDEAYIENGLSNGGHFYG